MKNLFELSQEEKNRIINLHENATKRLYLVEQEVVQGGNGDPYQYRKTGDKVEYATKGVNNWKTQTNPKGVEAINKMFTKSTQAPATAEGQPASTTASPAGTTPTGEALPTSVSTPIGASTTTSGATPIGASTTTSGATPRGSSTTTSGATPTPQPQGDVKTSEALTEKIKQNCGEIWKSYEGRLKGYQAQMKDKDFKAQKDIARTMSRDENKVFRYCHKLYRPKVTPDEKTKFDGVASNFKKLLSASYRFLAPSVVKMMSTTVDKAVGAGGEAVLKSLKIEQYNNHKLDKLIQESIRKNTRNL